MPDIAPFIIPITALIGALHNAAKLSNTPLKIVFIPSHALRQFPVNTPEINVVKPSNIVNTPLMREAIVFTAADIAPLIAEKATFTTGTITAMLFLISVAIAPNTTPTTIFNACNTAFAVLQVLLIFFPNIVAITFAAALTTFPIAPNTVLKIVFKLFIMLLARVLMLFRFALNFFISTPHLLKTFFIAFPTAVKMLFTILRLLKLLIAPFTVPAISLNGAFIIFTKPDNAPRAIVFNPFSAPFQSPVNMPFTNCATPLKIVLIFSIIGFTACTKPLIYPLAVLIAISHAEATRSKAPAILFTVLSGRNVENAPTTKFFIALIFVLNMFPITSTVTPAAV